MRTKLLMVVFMLLAPQLALADAANGKVVFESTCANVCHQTPQAGRLSAKQWQAVMRNMQNRMQSRGLDPLPEQDVQDILEYLAGTTNH